MLSLGSVASADRRRAPARSLARLRPRYAAIPGRGRGEGCHPSRVPRESTRSQRRSLANRRPGLVRHPGNPGFGDTNLQLTPGTASADNPRHPEHLNTGPPAEQGPDRTAPLAAKGVSPALVGPVPGCWRSRLWLRSRQLTVVSAGSIDSTALWSAEPKAFRTRNCRPGMARWRRLSCDY